MKTPLLLGLAICLSPLISPARAEDKKPDAPAPAAETLVKVIDSSNVDDLRANEQHVVTVKGKASRTKEWDGNGNATKAINFIDLDGGHFTTVTFASDFDKFKSHPAVLYKDKVLEVTGKLEPRNGQWQIKVNSPDQVKVISADDKKDPKDDKKTTASGKEEKAKDDAKEGEAKDEKTDTTDGKKRVDSKKFFK